MKLSDAVVAVAVSVSVAWSFQTAPRDVPRERVGTSSLSGIVTTADAAHRPLAWASVTLTGEALISPQQAVTDDDGRFRFEGLRGGLYALSASKPAYLSVQFGASRPQRQGTSIQLTDGENRAD